MEKARYLGIVVFTLVIARVAYSQDEDLTFPEGFSIGAGGASYQIEGGWNASDKGENVWDWYSHNKPWLIKDGSNGDVACDSYHKYREDVNWVKTIGLDHYRFSISWSRILPSGFANNVSEDGIQYYKNLIDELHANGIEPYVTLYHWDHPQSIEELGGWTNDMIVDWFEDYARIVFRELGPKVKVFLTMNEPNTFCRDGYASDLKAPGKELYGIGNYICGHNVLKAHARAYHIYDEEFRPTQKGKISIAIPCQSALSKIPGDDTSADIAFQFNCGWFGHPIFSDIGDYPEIMKRLIAENSKTEGYPRSRLPEFSSYWINYIKGTADFFALNHYTTTIVETGTEIVHDVTHMDTKLVSSVDPTWPETASDWLRVVPFGFGDILRRIKAEYNNPPVYVTENGMSDIGIVDDPRRIEYFHSYLKEMLIAVKRDGCNVASYTFWSLLDNYEWARGYTERFGVIHVDFASPNRTRTPKLSVRWWQKVLRTRKLEPVVDIPSNSVAAVIGGISSLQMKTLNCAALGIFVLIFANFINIK